MTQEVRQSTVLARCSHSSAAEDSSLLENNVAFFVLVVSYILKDHGAFISKLMQSKKKPV
jgi:hypothetical protein